LKPKGNTRRSHHDIAKYLHNERAGIECMIQTSYFGKAASLPNAVAISQGIPKWYNGARYKPLAPSWDIIRLKDPELYKKRYYQEVLSKLDPKQVAAELEGCILLPTKRMAHFVIEG
jgi:hypothetical protein